MSNRPSGPLVVKSAVIRSEKPGKGLEAKLAPNPNQMNRVIGYLADGARVVVAQRPGAGGMDFNKLVGGKVYAVAADALSPVYEKDGEGKPTKQQKTEDGLPLYSSSGFYLLSSKDYPAVDILQGWCALQDKGEYMLFMTPRQRKAVRSLQLDSTAALQEMTQHCLELLSDTHNLVAPFNEATNKKRTLAIKMAEMQAESEGNAYTGVQPRDLPVSPKDGNPFVALWVQGPSGTALEHVILRQAYRLDKETGRMVQEYYSAEEAVDHFLQSKLGQRLSQALAQGKSLNVRVAQGHVMRCSVSFKRKVANYLALENPKPYGDNVFIQAALQGWCKSIVGLMHSLHPNFPAQDYEVTHYVAAPRQAEVLMQKQGDKWSPPTVEQFTLSRLIGGQVTKQPQPARAETSNS